MNLLSWNCRELGNLQAILALHNLVKFQEPKLLFILETKLDVRRMEFIRVQLSFKYCFVVPSWDGVKVWLCYGMTLLRLMFRIIHRTILIPMFNC